MSSDKPLLRLVISTGRVPSEKGSSERFDDETRSCTKLLRRGGHPVVRFSPLSTLGDSNIATNQKSWKEEVS